MKAAGKQTGEYSNNEDGLQAIEREILFLEGTKSFGSENKIDAEKTSPGLNLKFGAKGISKFNSKPCLGEFQASILRFTKEKSLRKTSDYLKR